MKNKSWLIPLILLVLAGLACATNTPVARLPTPRFTRTPLPTFTNTPLPLAAPPTSTPAGVSAETAPVAEVPPTPAPPTATPIPTDTPPPTDTPTATPVPPTNTPAPPTAPPPPPPTATPVPPTATAVVASVLPTPTNTPQPDTPAGRYEIRSTDEDQNCAHVAVIGRVVEKGSDTPVQYVTIEVAGDENPYKGPYRAKTNEKGDYTVVIGEVNKDFRGIEFEVKVVGGANVKSEDKHEWTAGDDCHKDDSIQVMTVNWFRKNN